MKTILTCKVCKMGKKEEEEEEEEQMSESNHLPIVLHVAFPTESSCKIVSFLRQ